MSLRFPLLSLFAVLAVTGCGGTPKVAPPVLEPVVDTAPIAVAVDYADDLRNHQCKGGKGYIAFTWDFALGPPSMTLLDGIFEKMFREVETVPAGVGGRSAGGGMPLIEVHLTKFTGCDASWPIFNTTLIEIAYSAILWSAGGDRIAAWVGEGMAGPGDQPEKYMTGSWEPEIDYLAALTNLAMRKAAADFVVNYDRHPAIRAWHDR